LFTSQNMLLINTFLKFSLKLARIWRHVALNQASSNQASLHAPTRCYEDHSSFFILKPLKTTMDWFNIQAGQVHYTNLARSGWLSFGSPRRLLIILSEDRRKGPKTCENISHEKNRISVHIWCLCPSVWPKLTNVVVNIYS
jgi:hypothetical protein